MSKKIIAVDVDEVLFPFIPEFTRYFNAIHGTEISQKDFVTYEFEKVLGIPQSEITKHMYGFTDAGHAGVQPLAEAQAAIATLSKYYELIIVTARNPRQADATNKWLDEFFPDAFVRKHFVGFGPILVNPVTKASVCQKHGAFALIDDSITNLKECSAAGIEGILFGDYSWNSAIDLPVRVTRCTNWTAVLDYFDGR
jgi:5'(3')-deoxyribonucleotidase